MSELTEALRRRGADMDGAMDRFAGDEELYETCLKLFLSSPSFSALDGALRSGDCPAAFEAVHSLKGVAGNLGLTTLCRAACALTEPLRRGDASGLEGPYQALRAEKASLESLR